MTAVQATAVRYRAGEGTDARAVAGLLAAVSAQSPFLGERGLQPAPDKVERLLAIRDLRAATVVAIGPEGLLGYAQAVAGAPATMRHVAVVAIAVRAEARGRGIGRALLAGLVDRGRQQGWRRLRASVWANNEASRRLFAGAGFVLEGCIPEQLQDDDGRFVDELIYGLSLTTSPEERHRPPPTDATEP
jgi:L-amino acid N-acyltransferase YncA